MFLKSWFSVTDFVTLYVYNVTLNHKSPKTQGIETKHNDKCFNQSLFAITNVSARDHVSPFL